MSHEWEESFKIIRTFVKDFDLTSNLDYDKNTKIPLTKLIDSFLTINENL